MSSMCGVSVYNTNNCNKLHKSKYKFMQISHQLNKIPNPHVIISEIIQTNHESKLKYIITNLFLEIEQKQSFIICY